MDHDYWNQYYAREHRDILEPSSFARWCRQHFEPGQTLFELGCGNGRDALFFAREGLEVIACDQAESAIEHLSSRYGNGEFPRRPRFLCGEFQALHDLWQEPLDIVYSRFSLHAVRAEVAEQALSWSARRLRPGGQLLVEARSVLGSLYGKGEPRERDAFIYNGHYRRFLRRAELISELEELGFDIVEQIESSGLAVHRDDDPVVIRVLARR